MAVRAEHGFWKSPITSDLVAAELVRLNEPRIDGDSICWLEGRAADGGRTVPVRQDAAGAVRDELPAPWNIRSRVHEYGGGAYTVSGGTLYFSESSDQRVYRKAPGGGPEPLTAVAPARYADLVEDARRGRLLAVCEDHGTKGREASQSIREISVRQLDQAPRTLLSGADFYSNPCLSPDGSRMSWLEWNHPNMPWDGTALWTAELDSRGRPTRPRKVAGAADESIFQPRWSPDGALHFVSDRNGFWNLYRDEGGRTLPLHEREAEFGLPQWVFGMSTYGFADDGRVLCAYCERGIWNLALITPDSSFESVDTPYTQIDGIAVQGQVAVFRGASPLEPPSLVRLDLRTHQCEPLKQSSQASEGIRRYFSAAQSISFPTRAGRSAHAFHYPPRNPDYEPPQGDKPPLIIRLHGGPTGAASSAFSLATQFWTSRGFAVLDLNYAGSTGYGRAYRERLNGQWGVADVEDTLAAARHAATEGLADPERLIVKGGSAGGFTALCCLARSDLFAAGAAYYGIGDLQAMAADTHKFESRYNETLIGPWPETRALHAERSPLAAVDRIAAPTIFFQGSEDPVVPKAQTEDMVAALRRRGIPVAYYLFEGESHGFRNGENVQRSLDGELAFYGTMVLRKGLRFQHSDI